MKMVIETLEYLKKDGSVYKKRRPKNLGLCPDEECFSMAVDGLENKMKKAHVCRMNLVERVLDEPRKVAIRIRMAFNFEYDQLWTYEMI